MKDLSNLAKSLASKISEVNDNKIEAAATATITKVQNEVVADAIKENLAVDDISALATDEEVNIKLNDYVKKTDIFKNNYFYTKYDNTNGSHALLWNESDGGGSQYYNKTADVISYVGTNDGNEDGICVQIYSKSYSGANYSEIENDGITEILGLRKNEGVRINVNPKGAFYTKGTNTSANGGSVYNEIAVKNDVRKVASDLTTEKTKIALLQKKVSDLEQIIANLQTALTKVKDENGNPIYSDTAPSQEEQPIDDEL